MPSHGPTPISINGALESLKFLADRTPATTAEDSVGAFQSLSAYRDGGVFVGHWAGTSEWERHPVGDEIVMILDGETTIYFLHGEDESSAPLGAGEMIVVPQATWHRFTTPRSVKVLSVTPQPSDHSPNRPV